MKNSLDGQVGRLIALRGLWQFIVFQSVAVPFFQSRGMSSGEIFWLQACFFGMLCLCDIPSSILAERLGLKKTLLIGCALKGLGGMLLLIEKGSAPIFLAYLFIGAGNAFYSGLDYTLIHRHLEKHPNFELRLKKIQSISHGLTFFSIMASGMIGALLADSYGFHALIVCNAFFAWSSFLLALSIREERKISFGEGSHNFFHHFRMAFEVSISMHRRPRALILVLGGVIAGVFPYLLQLQASHSKMNLIGLGYLFSFQNGISAVMGFFVGKYIHLSMLKKIIRPKFILLLWITGFFVLSLDEWAAFFVAVLLIELGRILTTVVINSDFHLSFESTSRSAVSSLLSVSGRLLLVPTTITLGLISQKFPIYWLPIFIGGVIAVVLSLYFTRLLPQVKTSPL